MTLVAGIGDGLKELAIAPRTADVLGRAVALGFDQARIKDAVPVENSYTDILVVQPAQHRHGERLANGLDDAWDRRVLLQR
jgi:hypothetical protein